MIRISEGGQAMCVRFYLLALAVALLLGPMANATRAQTVEDWRATEDAEQKEVPKLEQRYHGVVPGSGNPLPQVEELKGKEGTWVTWPGFTMRRDGGSRIFLQTTIALGYQTEVRIVEGFGAPTNPEP